jgi:dTMP kinase
MSTGRDYQIIAVEGMDGAGKTTLIKGLQQKLSQGRLNPVPVIKPNRATVRAFRALTETPGDDTVLYQNVIPAGFRLQAYIVEAMMQFSYQADRFTEAGVVLFDRWFETWDAYCEPVDEYPALYAQLRAQLPRPDVHFHLRVPPALAHQRLIDREDRWCRTYSPPALRAKLEQLHLRYDLAFAGRPEIIVLDSTQPAGEVLAQAIDHATAALGSVLTP